MGGRSRVREGGKLQKLCVSEVSAGCQDHSSERKQSGGDEAQVMAVGGWKAADVGHFRRSLLRPRSQ